MPGPARAGVLIYAKNLGAMSSFYEAVLSMNKFFADAEHHILESRDMQLVLHLIPPHIASTFEIAVPPEPREEQAIKPFFTVDSLVTAEHLAKQHGGKVFGQVWSGPGFQVRNAFDCEGNIFQLRENAP
jgi:hypothetical protein